jgi:hypothetical protein
MSKQNTSAFLVAMFILALLAGVRGQDGTQYDPDIQKLVGKLVQYPEKKKLMEELSQDFQAANQADLDYIKKLKETGQPDIWYRVYQANERIDKRQALVKTLPQKTLSQCSLTFVDNTKDLDETRIRAARYSYALAQKMLTDSTPSSARVAYVELLRVANLKYEAADNLDKMMRQAILVGSTGLEFELYDKTGKGLTKDIVNRLTKIIWEYKRAKYGNYQSDPKGPEFKFTIRVVVDDISVSPDQIKDLSYEEQRDVMREGQVVDTITCLVNEHRQLKKATMIGRIDFYDNQLNQVVNMVPVKVETVFMNSYGTLQGNPDAAGDDTRELLNSKMVDYPTAEKMALNATDEFVKKASQVVLAQ